MPLPMLKEKILASGKINHEELEKKIKTKINELSGLISEEGACHIIANEFGIELANPKENKLKIKEIYAGMRNLSTAGKVVRKFEAREFSKGDKTGRVCSIVLGDETGTIRVVFWNDQVNLLDDVKEEDILEIKEVYTRENNNAVEVHLGDRGEIRVNPEGIEIGEVRKRAEGQRKKISELQNGEENIEVLGTIVQVFDPRFFMVHPESGRRIREGEEATITPVLSYVMNAVLDDGTGTIRAVFWKQQTNHLLDKADEQMAGYKENPAGFENIKTDLLGEQVKITGKVKKNEMFDRLEFNVQLVEKANPEEELRKLQQENFDNAR